MPEPQRLTLVACSDANTMAWNENAAAASRLAFLGEGPFLHLEVMAALNEPTLDAERLILDRAATAEAFLEVLASLPSEFSGDVLRIDRGGSGFLSATGRGGDRALYQLQPEDVLFYLSMHGIIGA